MRAQAEGLWNVVHEQQFENGTASTEERQAQNLARRRYQIAAQLAEFAPLGSLIEEAEAFLHGLDTNDN
jgi:hypothetical protein